MNVRSCVSLAYRKALRQRLPLAALTLLFVATCSGHSQQPKQQQLRIAAAADLQTVMPTLVEAYEHATGAKLTVSYGSSATLEQQLENGAPQDLFLAADYSFPEKLVAAKLTDEKAPTAYARGALVLWARKDSPLQPLNNDSLSDAHLQKLAIANELHAPYGRAAVAALTKLGLLPKLKDKLVVAENISGAAQFAESGNAQAALISLTIATSPHFQEVGSYVRIPAVAYPEIRQCAVVMKASPNRGLAHDFLRWLTSDAVQANLLKLGLAPAR
ncbi:MAG: molybdate ABC transporter substrate-binding protein [Acidobacteriota bacterium]|nr:molybdate ABC transporter substrate-binding protein [Acidobacteriota bacterium]